MRAKQAGLLRELTATFPDDTIKKWTDQIHRWNRDKVHEVDPYEDATRSEFAAVLNVTTADEVR